MSSLPVGKRNVKERVFFYSCLFCEKRFSDQEVLIFHLSVHQWEMESRKNWKYFCHYINLAATFLNSLASSLPENFFQSARKILPFLNWDDCPLGFYNWHHSHERDLMNTSKFFLNNLANAESHLTMPMDLSSTSNNAGIHHPTYISATAVTPIRTEITSSDVLAPTTAIGFPSDPSFLLDTSGVFHSYTGEIQTLRDGVGSNQFPGFTAGALPGGPCGLDQGSVGQCSRSNAETYEASKRLYIGDVPADATAETSSKRQKTISPPPVHTERLQTEELLLFKDVEPTSHDMEVPSDAEEEVQADLDLSLHM